MYQDKSCPCGQCQKLAMATVPYQRWGELYDWKTALCNGTIFPDLNFEFFAAKNMCCSFMNGNCSRREAMRCEIDAISFALNDLTLYLDTHGDDKQAMILFGKLKERRRDLLSEYASCFSPLTIDSIEDVDSRDGYFSWNETQLPWEGGVC